MISDSSALRLQLYFYTYDARAFKSVAAKRQRHLSAEEGGPSAVDARAPDEGSSAPSANATTPDPCLASGGRPLAEEVNLLEVDR